MKNYLRRLFFSVFFASLVFCSPKAGASHSMGADLTYRNIGGNTYEFTMAFYRDCYGILPGDTFELICSSSCFPAEVLYMFMDSGTGNEITPNCPTAITTCNGGNYTGIQQYVYRGTITLAGACSDWVFEVEECCRNSAITNIVMPGLTGMYLYATLDNSSVSGNNSPTFSNLPVPFACLGQLWCFNHGAFDIDGDSLAFSLIAPFKASGIPIVYRTPFSAANPFTSNPPLSFNPLTGDICFTPTNLEVTVMAVLIKEYRHGVLIGSVERDIQITVIHCTNQLPALSGIDGSNNYLLSVCAGTQVCFDIFSRDPDNNQNTSISWDHSIPSGTFTTISGQRESASFCWTPQEEQISTIPYCFTATVLDDNCPVYGNQTYSYCISVRGLNVNAGPGGIVGCNATTTLAAEASGGSGNYTYQWNNGQTSSSIVAGPGVYAVTVSDGRCLNNDTVQVLADTSVPVADFSMIHNCSSLNVQFQNNSNISGGSITSMNWNFGDGATSISTNPQHVYSSSGIYPVRLIVNSAGGCVDTIIRILELSSNQPSAAFTFNNACTNTPVNFADQSASPSAIISRFWKFGDGSVSTFPNPAHSYSISGLIPVTLFVTNANGCVDSVNQLIHVYPSPNAFAGLDDSLCPGIPYTLRATGGVSYTWHPLELDTSTVVVAPLSTQLYVVEVTDSNHCTSVDSVLIIVKPEVFVYAGTNHSICSGDSVTLHGSGNGSYFWSPGGETTSQIRVSPAASTNYTLTVTTSFGCTGFDQAFVAVNSRPVANAGLNQTICEGNQVQLNGSGGGMYFWQPGNSTSASITVAPSRTTDYALIVSNGPGCNDTDYVTVAVYPLPVASFQHPVEQCATTAVLLSDSSSVSTGSISWNWNFGNGVTSDLQNPSVVYDSAGNYQISLVVTAEGGCSDTLRSSVAIHPSPSADAGSDQAICFGKHATLTATGDGMYLWQPSGVSTPVLTVTPSTSTNYQLIVTNSFGCRDTANVRVTVNPLPDAGFTNSGSGCSNSPFQFFNQSTISVGSIDSWRWSFGNHVFSSIEDPVIIFSDTGMYFVELVAISEAGCTDSVAGVVKILPSPVAEFSSNEVCVHHTIDFHNASHISGGEMLLYEWSFGDNTNTANSVNPSHLYTDYGNYHAVLKATSSRGCRDSASAMVVVHPIPQPDFSSIPACERSTVYFDDHSSIPIDAINSWQWEFGDNTFSEMVNPLHSYSAFGNYSVKLKVTSSFGCADSVTRLQRINPNPILDFHVDPVCTGDATHFVNHTTVAQGSIAQWEWIFGDLTTSYEFSPTHFYQQPGNYNVQLTAFTDSGCRSTLVLPWIAVVHPLPDATFIPSTTNVSELFPTVSFINQSETDLSHIWDFGDGEFSTAYSPVHLYQETGSYNVLLIEVDQNGCRDSMYSRIEVKPAATVFVPNSFTPNGDGINDDFRPNYWNVVRLSTQIFDRWGVKIVELSGLNDAWDGYTNEKQAPADVYIYRIEYTDITGKNELLIGHVTLIR